MGRHFKSSHTFTKLIFTRLMKASVIALLLVLFLPNVHSFYSGLVCHKLASVRKPSKLRSNGQSKDAQNAIGGNFVTKGLFALAEVFGTLTSARSQNKPERPELLENMSESTGISTKPLSQKDISTISESIKTEYESIFWATGNMDTSLWAPDCVFVDPFSSLQGSDSTERFQTNANNLGKWVEDPYLRITSFSVEQEDLAPEALIDTSIDKRYVVKVGWTYRSLLKLPWRPVLAATGVTAHYLDPNSGLIVRYEESWKSNPWEVVGRIFKPSRQ